MPPDLVSERDAQATVLGPAGQAVALAEEALALAALAAQAAGYARASKAPNTRRAYAADWRHFASWCQAMRLQALPADPSTVALYLTAHTGALEVSTLRRRLACIGQAHRAAGHDSPCSAAAVRVVWQGIARKHGHPPRRKTPLVVEAMRAVLDELGEGPRDVRDRALLLIAWAGALRRSEVVALWTDDIAVEDRGLVVTVRHSKTDQQGAGRLVGLPYGRRPAYCPARSYTAWVQHLQGRHRPVFCAVARDGTVGRVQLDDKHVARLVKRVCDRAGLVGDYSGHSLRAGFATAAAAAGASERAIMAQTGHRSLLIARSYIRPAQLFDDNAAAVAAL